MRTVLRVSAYFVIALISIGQLLPILATTIGPSDRLTAWQITIAESRLVCLVLLGGIVLLAIRLRDRVLVSLGSVAFGFTLLGLFAR